MTVEVVETVAPAATEAPAVTEAPKVEDKPAEKPADPPKPKPGEFARKAAMERERIQKAAAEKAGAEEAAKAKAEARELRSRLDAYEKRRGEYAKNPLQALTDMFPGMEPVKAFELLAETARNSGKAPVQAETYALQQRLDAMEKQRVADLEAQKQAAEQAQRQQAEAAEKAFRAEVADFVKANAETYELTALYGQADAVYAVIEAEYAKSGKIISSKEASEKVEAKLEELVEKATSAKKVSAKMAAKFKPADPAPKTLSNDLATQVSTERPSAASTEAERMRRAAEALSKFGI